MPQHALRQRPDIEVAVQDAAIESLEDRILRMLAQQADCDLDTDVVFVRPQCTIATMLVNQRVASGQQPITVICPRDEIRRAGMHEALRRGQPDQITLFPITEESYQEFLGHIGGGNRGYGEHITYRNTDLGWQGQEYG